MGHPSGSYERQDNILRPIKGPLIVGVNLFRITHTASVTGESKDDHLIFSLFSSHVVCRESVRDIFDKCLNLCLVRIFELTYNIVQLVASLHHFASIYYGTREGVEGGTVGILIVAVYQDCETRTVGLCGATCISYRENTLSV